MFKFIYKGFSAFLAILMGATTLMPMTDSEAAALGPNAERFEVVQMRVAKAMMNVAPDFTVARFAQATELPPEIVHDMLTAKAEGTLYSPYTSQADAGAAEAANSPRGTGAFGGSGAKFVRVD